MLSGLFIALNDISALVGDGRECNRAYTLVMCTDVSTENLYLLGFQTSGRNAKFPKSILLPIPFRFCLFCNFGFFLVAIAKEFLESFHPRIKQQHLLQINSKPQHGVKPQVQRVRLGSGSQGCAQAATNHQCPREGKAKISCLLQEGTEKDRAPCSPRQKHLERNKASKLGHPACRRGPRCQEICGCPQPRRPRRFAGRSSRASSPLQRQKGPGRKGSKVWPW